MPQGLGDGWFSYPDFALERRCALGLPHEMTDAPDAKRLVDLGGSISFVDVCFSYPNGEQVLQDFTLRSGRAESWAGGRSGNAIDNRWLWRSASMTPSAAMC
jgi:hypothetical protein